MLIWSWCSETSFLGVWKDSHPSFFLTCFLQTPPHGSCFRSITGQNSEVSSEQMGLACKRGRAQASHQGRRRNSYHPRWQTSAWFIFDCWMLQHVAEHCTILPGSPLCCLSVAFSWSCAWRSPLPCQLLPTRRKPNEGLGSRGRDVLPGCSSQSLLCKCSPWLHYDGSTALTSSPEQTKIPKKGKEEEEEETGQPWYYLPPKRGPQLQGHSWLIVLKHPCKKVMNSCWAKSLEDAQILDSLQAQRHKDIPFEGPRNEAGMVPSKEFWGKKWICLVWRENTHQPHLTFKFQQTTPKLSSKKGPFPKEQTSILCTMAVT